MFMVVVSTVNSLVYFIPPKKHMYRMSSGLNINFTQKAKTFNSSQMHL